MKRSMSDAFGHHLFPLVVLLAAIAFQAQGQANSDPVAVTTWHNDYAHTGQNLRETNLKPDNVNQATFGKLFTQPIDGYAYAQPLYVPNVAINVPGGKNNGAHNVVYIATEHDSVYAFDADSSDGANANPLWKVSFLDPTKGVITVPWSDERSHDLEPEIGITGTPIIDRQTNTIYLVSKTREVRGSGDQKSVHYVQKFHALDLGSGAEKLGGPLLLGDCNCIDAHGGKYENSSILQYPGSGAPHDTFVDGRIVFNAFLQNQRPALILVNGTVYICWASHADHKPVHGWIAGFSAKDLALQSVLNTSPNGNLDTIWMGGSSPAVDRDGSLLISLGNGDFDVDRGGKDYGECVIRVTPKAGSQPWDRLAITDYFCPTNFEALNKKDNDLGSGGPLLLPDQPGAHPHELIVSGKEGMVYVLDRDHLGGINNPPDGPDNVVEEVPKNEIMLDRGRVTASSINTAAYWNGFVYYTGHQRPIMQIPISGGLLAHAPLHLGNRKFDFPFPTPQISADGNQDAIVWVQSSGPNGALFAYDASDVTRELWNSTMAGSRDQYGPTVKFAMPVIANGKVFVAGQTTFAAFGHLHRSTGPLNSPVDLTANPVSSREIDVAWTGRSANNDGYRVERSVNGGTFQLVGATGPGVTNLHDAQLQPHTTYAYRVYAYNSTGNSEPVGPAQAATKDLAVGDGLVGWWSFDEGTGNDTADLLHSGNLGHISGEVSWVGGRVGDAALSFHGAGVAPGFVAVASAPSLNFTPSQSFSISAWIEPANVPAKWSAWITHASGESAGYGICSNPSNQWVFGTASNRHNISGGTITTGWHHLVAVQDGSAKTRTLYLDGKPIARGPAADASAAGELWIGGAKNDEEQYVDGTVDDVRVYNRALSGQEIEQLGAWHNPKVPTVAAKADNGAVELTFGGAGEDGAQLRIQRSTASGDWSDIAAIPATQGSYADTTARAKGVIYRYRVRATNDAGASGYSKVAQVQIGATVGESAP